MPDKGCEAPTCLDTGVEEKDRPYVAHCWHYASIGSAYRHFGTRRCCWCSKEQEPSVFG